MTVGIPGEEVFQTGAEWVCHVIAVIGTVPVFMGVMVALEGIFGINMFTVALTVVVWGASIYAAAIGLYSVLSRTDLAVIDENDRLVFNRDWDSSVVGE